MAIDRGMSVEQTRDVMNRYAAGDHGDLTMLSDDVVFRVMGTGLISPCRGVNRWSIACRGT